MRSIKQKAATAFSMAFLFLLSFTGRSQNAVTVNVATTLNDVSNKPLGINMNYLMDGSYVSPTSTTTSALQQMGVKFMRYPGGEKADNYLWSVAPWTASSPHFARPGSCEWPSGDTRFALNDYSTANSNVLDFDEFMTMCRAVGGEPLIVVAYDAMYKAGSCGPAPTRAQLLANAEEWVRYANIKKGYNIKYWMVGNESYHSGSYNGVATAAQYRNDVIEFSQRMKAIDPTIKIIANGDGSTWWSTVLPTAAPYIDFLGVSNYPVYNFSGGYTYYKNNTPGFLGPVNSAITAINSYAPSAHRARLKVIATEYNANDWSNAWTNINDLGHALASFEILGEHLKNPKVEAALMWNTRWVNNKTAPNDIYDAIKSNGTLQPNGRALAIWGSSLLEKMVSATSTTKVRTFASYKPSTNELNVYLINKETTAQAASVSFSGYITSASGERWEMKGNGPADLAPTWSQTTGVTLNGSALSLTLPAVSITLIKLRPAGTISSPAASTVTVNNRISSGANDVEQIQSGGMYTNSSDIELVNDGTTNGNQTIGLRFTGLNIPRGATITNAYIQFTTDEIGSTTTSLAIKGENVDNSAAFTTAGNNVSSRIKTSASVSWSPPAWTAVDAAGTAQRTPDVKSIVQQIVSRTGWTSGNALSFIITGTGRRTAYAYESSPAKAPLLVVQYTTSSGARMADTTQTASEPQIEVVTSMPPEMMTYPNPFNDVINLKIEANRPPEEKLVIEVFDLTGKLCLRKEEEWVRDEPIQLQTHMLSAGQYIVVTEYNKERLAKKIIKY